MGYGELAPSKYSFHVTYGQNIETTGVAVLKEEASVIAAPSFPILI
jgi:hypothetical protein